MEPYNLITQKEAGLSIFTTSSQDREGSIFREVQKATAPVWVNYYDYKTQEKTTYSGVVQFDAAGSSQLRQCFKSLLRE